MINNINLLDLNNDILNIIGDSVKKDNADRMEELMRKRMTMYYRTNNDLTKILEIDYGIKNNIALDNYIIDFYFKIDVEDAYAEIAALDAAPRFRVISWRARWQSAAVGAGAGCEVEAPGAPPGPGRGSHGCRRLGTGMRAIAVAWGLGLGRACTHPTRTRTGLRPSDSNSTGLAPIRLGLGRACAHPTRTRTGLRPSDSDSNGPAPIRLGWAQVRCRLGTARRPDAVPG
jgi:hypothetical protein